MAQQNVDCLEASADREHDEPKHGIFDTNMEMLPGKRTKGSGQAAEEPEEKPMSKRKKRKLEQLQKKHASKELRSQLLSELRSVQLTPEQAELMRASQSTRVSRRDKVAIAKRRMASGVPLSKDMQSLRRRPKSKTNDEEGDDASDEDDNDEGADSIAGETLATASSSTAPANFLPVMPVIERTSGAAASTCVKTQAAELPKPQVTASPVVPSPSSSPMPAHLLTPVRVQRTAEIEEQRSKLPAVMCEQEVVEAVLSNDVVLISGDTGCGKSTQIPQFLYEAGVCNGDRYQIGVTQPRRVAAISVSQRVEQELNEPGRVGYQVRYDRNHCSRDTRIKFMTDGILLRELQADFLCKKYVTIVIDEAHERGVNCDILIGLLSRAVQRRRRNYEEALAAGRYKNDGSSNGEECPPPPLRLVIMSATLRVCDFTQNQQLFLRPPPVVKIDARTFPVTVHFARSTEEDYIKAAHRSVLQIHKQLPPGTILVFVTGRQEVHRLCGLLRRSSASLRNASAGETLEDEKGDDDGELELLQGSDDEDVAFDDDLGTADGTSAKQSADKRMETTRRKKRSDRTATDCVETGATATEIAAASPQEGKLKKRRKKAIDDSQQITHNAAEELPADTSVDTGSAAVPLKKKKRKKKIDGVSAPNTKVGEIAQGAEEEVAESDSTKLKHSTEGDGDECEVSFRIDAEEDVVVLEAEAVAAEDAKDMEARRQKRQKMVKLDKSRTAGGVFRGTGFGEGPLRVYPLYAQLPAREQLAAFVQPKEGERNIVVSTNVAETSVTLPNVRYVVDTGQEKRRKYKASSGVSSFAVDRISKASADQRAGRAGRLGPGHSYRLYSAAAYENHMAQFAPIAVLHVPMDPVLLLIASLGVPYLDLFPWPTPPPAEAVSAAMNRLQGLGALANSPGTNGLGASGRTLQCTPLGFKLATLPVAPRYAKMLLSSVTSGEDLTADTIAHACALVAALSVGNLISLDSAGSLLADVEEAAPREGENELLRAQREARKRLREAQGKTAPKWTQLRDDADGLLWLMGGYAWAISNGEEQADQFCRANQANPRQMSEAHSLMQQLGSLLQKRLSLEAAGLALKLPLKPRPPTLTQAHLLKSHVANGLVDHVAVAKPELGRNAYVCKDLGPDAPVFVHSSSNTYRYRPHPSVIVFNEIISSSRPFMRDCVSLDPLTLSKRAAAGDCPLLQLGEFLAVPAPRYLKDKDSVLGFASPSYVPLDYTLPTIEVEVPSDSIFRYKVFAKALLEGEVLASLPAATSLLARPALVLHSPNNPRVMGIVGPLWEQRIGSRASLLKHWEKNRQFLLEGYLKWLPPALHDDARMSWPPVGSSKKRS